MLSDAAEMVHSANRNSAYRGTGKIQGVFVMGGKQQILRFMARKPLTGLQHLPLSDGVWYDMNDEKLWVWRLDTKATDNG